MPSRKTAVATTKDTTAERRRSTRISKKPTSAEPAVVTKPRVKKADKKRAADTKNAVQEGRPQAKKVSKRAADTKNTVQEGPQAKKLKIVNEDEDGEEHDQLADDDDVDDNNDDNDKGEEMPIKPVNIGDSLPAITLKNEKNEDVNVAELVLDKGLVLFLVPKADTPGCTQQACGYRDSYPDFTALGFNVYCLSADDPADQANWQTKKSLPYSLLSDKNRVLIKALGAAEGKKTRRSHFVFTKGGRLVDKKMPVKPVDSPQQALVFIKDLQARKS